MNDLMIWPVASGGGTIDGSGLYTAPSTSGTATIQASADGVTETAPITIAGDNGGEYVGNDGLIYVQATDVHKVKVFTSSGGYVEALPFAGPFPQGMTFRGAGDINLPNGSYLDASQTDLVLKNAGGSVIQSYIDSPDGAWTGMALDPNGTSFWACDESCYVFEFNIATGAKQEQFWGSQDLGGLGVVPDPQPGITLGDGSSNQVLQGNGNDAQNLTPLHLFVPADLPTGTTVTLTDSVPNEVDVWNSASPQTGDTPVLGTGTGSATWTVGSQNVPSTLYVGIEKGSASVGDIQFTLTVTPPGGNATTAKTAPATAMVMKMFLRSAGQKQVNILTSMGGLNSFDLVPLSYTYEGPVQAQITISQQAAQEIEVWTTGSPTASDYPVMGGSSGKKLLNLTSTDIVNGQLWVGASAIPKIGTISDNIQFTLRISRDSRLLFWAFRRVCRNVVLRYNPTRHSDKGIVSWSRLNEKSRPGLSAENAVAAQPPFPLLPLWFKIVRAEPNRRFRYFLVVKIIPLARVAINILVWTNSAE